MKKHLSSKRPWFSVRYLWVIVIVLFQTGFTQSLPVRAQSSPAALSKVRVIEAEKSGLMHPAGLAYAAQADVLQVVETGGTSGIDVVSLNAAGRNAGSIHLSGVSPDLLNLAYDNLAGRLLFLQPSTHQLVAVQAGLGGVLDPARVTRYDTGAFGLVNPQGMAVDPASGAVLILDAAGPRIVRVTPAGGSFDAAALSSLDLQSAGLTSPRGIALDPATGHFQLYNPADQTLVELTQAGQVVASRDLSGFNLNASQALVFAPSADQTDDPAIMNLYLADSGSAGQEGRIVEFSLVEDAAPVASSSLTTAAVTAAGPTFASTLVRTTDMATLSPASPDPSGITYLPDSNRLLVTDGEVDETVNGITHFNGANVWELSMSGSVQRTANITTRATVPVPVSNEPTGIALDTKNGHFYITDDNTLMVYDVNPGKDGTIGTADDSVTSFSTASAGSNDPEGITYDSQNDRLFLTDGINREIYQFTPSGTLINHFDVSVIGARDPESVEFNPESGTLFVMNSNAANIRILEITRSGTLLQTITTTVAGLAPAGLAYAPASDGSGDKHFYVVERGIDNNVDPNIVDGKLYELTAPTSAPVNTAPIVSAGTNQAATIVNQPITIPLSGTVNDDGLPNPPATVTATWSQVSGPNTVTFGDIHALATSATFSEAGSYVLRLSASDGALSASDTITVTVNSAVTLGTNFIYLPVVRK